jgi:ankyrin repeat protein
VCKQLIDAGADVTVKNLDGATALHYLARITNPENAKQYVELLKLLLRKGAAVNEVNRHNETPLHQAAMKGATHAVEFLVTNKAEANMQNEFGETALHYAVRLGAVKCIELLLAANADVFLEGEREEGSALTLAEVTGQAEILGMMKRSSSCVHCRCSLVLPSHSSSLQLC